MKPTKTDRRVNRTRRLLREALFSLVMEMGYDAITIEQITDRADLGRTTFYLHYRDKEDLLLESIETIADDLRAQVDAYLQTQQDQSLPPNPILLVFQHAAMNASLYRIILRGGAANSVLARIRTILGEAALDFFKQRFGQRKPASASRVPPDVMIHQFTAALLGLMTWWLDQGMHYSPEQISLYFRDLFFNGALDVLGGENFRFPTGEVLKH
jgi:AcrR family transcriptional regulator